MSHLPPTSYEYFQDVNCLNGICGLGANAAPGENPEQAQRFFLPIWYAYNQRITTLPCHAIMSRCHVTLSRKSPEHVLIRLHAGLIHMILNLLVQLQLGRE
eukprot:806518-Amorphochlora_amoeboformis.AAC.1